VPSRTKAALPRLRVRSATWQQALPDRTGHFATVAASDHLPKLLRHSVLFKSNHRAACLVSTLVAGANFGATLRINLNHQKRGRPQPQLSAEQRRTRQHWGREKLSSPWGGVKLSGLILKYQIPPCQDVFFFFLHSGFGTISDPAGWNWPPAAGFTVLSKKTVRAEHQSRTAGSLLKPKGRHFSPACLWPTVGSGCERETVVLTDKICDSQLTLLGHSGY
jgi:hypothetical protein